MAFAQQHRIQQHLEYPMTVAATATTTTARRVLQRQLDADRQAVRWAEPIPPLGDWADAEAAAAAAGRHDKPRQPLVGHARPTLQDALVRDWTRF